MQSTEAATEPDSLTTGPEARSRLCISATTFWRWHRAGVIPVVHIRKRVYVRTSDLDALIASGMPSQPMTAEVSR